MRYIAIIILFLLPFNVPAQESTEKITVTEKATYTPIVKTIFYKLGEKILPLKVQQYGDRNDIVFINLHDDETTSVEATKRILEEKGGLLIEIENNQQRMIRFRSGKTIYSFDPNRIFSKEGLSKSLKETWKISSRAVEEVDLLAKRILKLFPEEPLCIIALHNNTPDFFSSQSYAAGNERNKDARKVYINPEQDNDDFFFTTDASIYEDLANKKFNTILQDNKNCTEDGSLSVYCGKKNIRYVNCETEHGKTEQYYDMMNTLVSLLISEKK